MHTRHQYLDYCTISLGLEVAVPDMNACLAAPHRQAAQAAQAAAHRESPAAFAPCPDGFAPTCVRVGCKYVWTRM
jgi:hypothetical protein